VAAASGLVPRSAWAAIAPHADVVGPAIATAEMRAAAGTFRPVEWKSLSTTSLEPGSYEIRFRASVDESGSALRLPWCAGRSEIRVDGAPVASSPGPVVAPIAPGTHEVTIGVRVSAYERRLACGEEPRAGRAIQTSEGLGELRFSSPAAARGGGTAVVFVPPGHDIRRPATLLVGLHPWNGTIWTYAAYAELLDEARARDVVLLLPSGLGNSLYTAEAEDEVLRAIAALGAAIALDPAAISIWGASMGGAGATTIGFHHPDRFATVTSFFGDSRYDLSTYVRALLPDEAAAHRVNALDVVDNARWLPVFLVHGESDRTSPIRQSEILADALSQRGFAVRFDRVPGMGHAGALVGRYLRELVARAAGARVPSAVPRVTYRSVRPGDSEAYGVRFLRASPNADAYVDVEHRADGVHVLRADGVRALRLARGALGTPATTPPPLVLDASTLTDAAWDPAP
jgi:pimeloyl-ACP methyl ester carboxylesterase